MSNARRLPLLPGGRRRQPPLRAVAHGQEGCESPSQGPCSDDAPSNVSHQTEFAYDLRRGWTKTPGPASALPRAGAGPSLSGPGRPAPERPAPERPAPSEASAHRATPPVSPQPRSPGGGRGPNGGAGSLETVSPTSPALDPQAAGRAWSVSACSPHPPRLARGRGHRRLALPPPGALSSPQRAPVDTTTPCHPIAEARTVGTGRPQHPERGPWCREAGGGGGAHLLSPVCPPRDHRRPGPPSEARAGRATRCLTARTAMLNLNVLLPPSPQHSRPHPQHSSPAPRPSGPGPARHVSSAATAGGGGGRAGRAAHRRRRRLSRGAFCPRLSSEAGHPRADSPGAPPAPEGGSSWPCGDPCTASLARGAARPASRPARTRRPRKGQRAPGAQGLDGGGQPLPGDRARGHGPRAPHEEQPAGAPSRELSPKHFEASRVHRWGPRENGTGFEPPAVTSSAGRGGVFLEGRGRCSSCIEPNPRKHWGCLPGTPLPSAGGHGPRHPHLSGGRHGRHGQRHRAGDVRGHFWK